VRVLLGKIHVGEKTIPGAGENDDAVLPVATHLVKGVPQLLVQAARVGTPGGGAAVVVDGDFENPVAAFEADKAVAVLVIGEPAHGVLLKVYSAGAVAAVGQQAGAVDIGGPVRRQVEHQVRHLGRVRRR